MKTGERSPFSFFLFFSLSSFFSHGYVPSFSGGFVRQRARDLRTKDSICRLVPADEGIDSLSFLPFSRERRRDERGRDRKIGGRKNRRDSRATGIATREIETPPVTISPREATIGENLPNFICSTLRASYLFPRTWSETIKDQA